jgi:hypothetical protein
MAARTQAVAAMERALVGRRRQRALRRVAIFGAGGAALAAAAIGLTMLASRPAPAQLGSAERGSPTKRPATFDTTHSPSTPPTTDRVEIVATDAVDGTTVVGGSARGAGLDGTELPAGSRIVTPAAGSARLALSTGTRLTVGPGSELGVVRNGAIEVFRLDSGGLRAEVAQLHIGERFLVDTPDAEIEVRGTIFEVRVGAASDACGGARTQLIVTEGVVTVRHEGEVVRVGAGEHWPSDCVRAHVTGHRVEIGRTSPSAAAPAPEALPLVALEPPSAPSPVSASRLTEMNDAYARAVALRQRGEVGPAIAAFTSFTREYADGPLDESAHVELLRLLVSTDRERARADAERYLRNFPAGFAREEAARVLQ